MLLSAANFTFLHKLAKPMKFPALFSVVFCLLLALTASLKAANSVELIAGWNFGQFVGVGAPSTDPLDFNTVTSVTSNFSGTVSPSPTDGGVYRAQNAGSGFFTAGTGVIDFSTWTAHDGTSFTPGGVSVYEVTSIEAANGTTVNDRNMYGGDDNNAQLRFTSGSVTDFSITLSTAGFSDYNPDSYGQPNDFNFTLAAYKFSGGSASIEWFFNGSSLGSVDTNSSAPAAFSIDLPASFYGLSNATLTGRVSGDIAIDHIQFNGIKANPVTFAQSPVNQSVTAGATVSFSVVVTGASNPTYQWRRNGLVISNSSTINGATSSTLELKGVTTDQAGNYTVVVNNNGAIAESDPGVLTVNTVPVITNEPSSSSANPGDTITFLVEASGSPVPSYLWFKDGVALSDGNGISGSTTRTLTLSNLTLASSGVYTVTVTNVAGADTSSPATLAVVENSIAPTIQEQPADTTVKVGQEAVFRVAASGAPSPSYQWYFGGDLLIDGSGIVGATTATLRITPTSAAQAGDYRVTVSNTAGTIESEFATLTVQVAPTIPAGSGPVSQAVNVGSNVTFSASATGLPAPTFQWFKGETALDGQTAASLALTNVTLDSAGDYSVVATNAAGNVRSAAATLTVYVPAQIVTDPVGLTIGSGSAFTLTVTATGTPAPSYQWRKNGEEILNATGSTYIVTSSTTADAGDYTVVATNAGGSDTSAVAKVEVAVRVPRVSGTRILAPGTQIVLDSQFRADGGYRFQWLRNGKAIAGATASTYLIPSAESADSGKYAIRVYAASGRYLTTITVVNLRISVAGSYDTLLRDVESDEVIGRVQVTVTDSGLFTGSIAFEDGKRYSLKGTFAFPASAYQGTAEASVTRSGELSGLLLDFNLDARASSLAVQLSLAEDDGITAEGEGVLRASANVAWKGKYTLTLVPQAPVPEGQPTAITNLTATIDAKGLLALSGKLADGTSIKASFPSSVNANYAVFLQPYKNAAGHLAGDLNLILAGLSYKASADSSGNFSWVKPAGVSASAIDLALEPSLEPR
jgi:hypothetical protein